MSDSDTGIDTDVDDLDAVEDDHADDAESGMGSGALDADGEILSDESSDKPTV